MTPAARLSAAIEVFADIEARRRPAAQALKDWGLSHRFAGSGDRAAIAGLVYDALRRKASSAWIMGAETPRAILLGMLRRERGLMSRRSRAEPTAARFAPEPLTDEERARLRRAISTARRRTCSAIIPNGSIRISRDIRRRAGRGGRRAGSRAPLDLRVNTLKGNARGCGAKRWPIFAAADALVAARPAHRARRRCQEPGDPCRARLHQGPDRNPGRGLAACGAAQPAPSPASR
jgi:16S rRNA (cytosine967-C5)-methyltransferase